MMCFGHVANDSESIKETVKKSKGAPFFNTSDLSVNVVKSGYYGKCDTIFGMSKSVGQAEYFALFAHKPCSNLSKTS